MPENTPMMMQYKAIKAEHQDCILMFRLGDFYEMFLDDAKLCARELELTLTTRDRGKDVSEQVPMCGVPYHAVDTYLKRLIAKGYKVAICEQTEDPALATGLVERAVIRIVTPGTVIDGAMLEQAENNFIASVCCTPSGAALAYADLSTGELRLVAVDDPDPAAQIMNELFGVAPKECVLGGAARGDERLKHFLSERLNCKLELGCEALFEPAAAEQALRDHFGPALELPETPSGVAAVGALLAYFHQTQMRDLSHISRIERNGRGETMELDVTARRNLELTRTLRSGEKRGTLLWVLDQTETPMGQRMLRAQLERPLMKLPEIHRRQDAVEELLKEGVLRGELRRLLGGIGDLERLIGRVVYGNANARDLLSLAESIEPLEQIKALTAQFQCALLAEAARRIDPLRPVYDELSRALVDQPPVSVREGGMIRAGYSAEVDRLRELVEGGGAAVAAMEARERERTGIRTLKVSHNKVFGYYIDISKSFLGNVPDDYIRKQTLVNNERFITPELKQLEGEILGARESIVQLEYKLFCDLREAVGRQLDRIQQTASALARLDMLLSFARVAEENHYCRPEVDASGRIEIRDGRHPVVERMLKGGLFVPNDTELDQGAGRAAIITGPNMAGKSTYMRQVALMVIMAQTGSFVPARSARIGLVDKVFTRVGASDDLASGYSTFMLEMVEIAEILKNATPRSLLILDEVGRGTSTFDGMAIARAVLEYCADRKKLGAKTMFATHYHELTSLEALDGIRNYYISAKKRGDEIIFLRRIVRGHADDSYGIEVAKLAGVPKGVVKRARDILAELESGAHDASPVAAPAAAEESGQLLLGDPAAEQVAEQLRRTDVETLTPIEALNLLYQWKKELGR